MTDNVAKRGKARRAAFNALTTVTKEGAYTSLALKEHLPSDMPAEDKAFASRLLRTTLENLLRIDYIINNFNKSGRLHGSVRNVLRLGVCQLMFMDTEDYAAVSESVELARQVKPQMKGFVNAVMRSVSRGRDSIEYPAGKNAQALSILSSYPVWICEKYIADFGYEFAEKLLTYKERPGISVRANTLRTNSEEFIKELEALGLVYSSGGIENLFIVDGLSDIENLKIYKNGWMAVQSQSAMQAVIRTGIKPGMKVLDCCAAPGGKSAFAAALTDNKISITAWDIHPHRVDMTIKNFERLGVNNADVQLRDASVYSGQFDKAFDAVIVDAPCSAMGLMHKSPDIRYSRKQEDIKALSDKQFEILSVCSKYVKPGGLLAYYTCSINKEENEEVTGKFLSLNENYEYAEPPETLYPHLCGSDGFYIAVMKRKI